MSIFPPKRSSQLAEAEIEDFPLFAGFDLRPDEEWNLNVAEDEEGKRVVRVEYRVVT